MKKTILATLIISIFFAFTCTASATTSEGQAAAKSTPASTDTVSLSNDTVMPASSSSVALVFKRTSSSQAKAQAAANRGGASYITSTITLQKKNPVEAIRKLPLHQKQSMMIRSIISNISL